MTRLAFVFALASLLALICVAWMDATRGPDVDFTSFWAAGHLALSGHGSLAYDETAHRAAETTVAVMTRANPFPYPPPFLFAVTPFGFTPYWLAYLLWIATTGALYVAAVRPVLPAHYALGFPAAFDNVTFGQNAFLTCSAFAIGTSLLESQPFLAGAVLGLFVCKPQLACLFPLVLLASRNWRAIGGAAVSSIALIALGAIVFGLDSYAAFLAVGPRYAAMMAQNEWPWNQVASVFGAVRYFGVPQSAALLLQALCALLAAAVTWRAWAKSLEERVPILATATLLVSPYLFTYDSLLLVIAVGWFVRKRIWAAVVVLWLLSLATILSLFGLCPTPNLTPVAAIVALGWLHSDRLPDWRIGFLPFGRIGA